MGRLRERVHIILIGILRSIVGMVIIMDTIMVIIEDLTTGISEITITTGLMGLTVIITTKILRLENTTTNTSTSSTTTIGRGHLSYRNEFKHCKN